MMVAAEPWLGSTVAGAARSAETLPGLWLLGSGTGVHWPCRPVRDARPRSFRMPEKIVDDLACVVDLGNWGCPDVPRKPDTPRKWDARWMGGTRDGCVA